MMEYNLMDKKEEDTLKKRSICSRKGVTPEICFIEVESTENGINFEKKSPSPHFLVNWCSRVFCIIQTTLRPEDDEVVLYVSPRNKP
jgi:hypothetical protein